MLSLAALITASIVSLARVAGELIIRSGSRPRRPSAFPILGASRFPRSASGRSKSGTEESSQLDFACRNRSRVFIALASSASFLDASARTGLVEVEFKRRNHSEIEQEI